MLVPSQEAVDHLESKVVPEYPEMGIANRIQNNEQLMIVIDEQGQVVDAEVKSGHPAFAKASLDAVKQWKYRPFMLNGAPVRVETIVYIPYRLGGEENWPPLLTNVPVSVSSIAGSDLNQAQPSTQAQPSLEPAQPRPLGKGVIGGIITGQSDEDIAKGGLGRIGVSFLIKKDGSVGDPKTFYMESISEQFATTEHPELERQALESVGEWKYPPLLLEGQPIEARTGVVLTFKFESPAETLESSVDRISPNYARSAGKTPVLPLWQMRWLRIDEATMNGMRIKYSVPAYPQMARIAHIQGDVVMNFYIDKEGRVANLKAVSGHPILIQAALDAVKDWQYKPVVINGQPVEVLCQVVTKFRM
jgi:TonB family protein